MTVSRNSYLPLISGPVREHFMLSAPVVIDEMWFDFNGIPLKWHYPIGVLYDLLATQQDLPWSVTVHFQEFPSSVLLRCGAEDEVKSHVNNTLKEANFIKHGDGTKFNSLSVTESDGLWNGIRNGDFDIFWASNKLLATSIASLKWVPIRIVQDNLPFLQDLVPPKDEHGNENTLSNVLAHFLPQYATGSSPASQVVLLQGIEPPLESTIVWLYDRFSHPDNFLYVIFRTKENHVN